MTKKIPTRRNGYYYKEINGIWQLDDPYVSVTKVLGDVLSKPALIYWTGKRCSDIALRDPNLNTDEVMAQLKMEQKESQERGRAVHSVAEILAGGGSYTPIEKYSGYCEALNKWWIINKPESIKSELEVFNDRIKMAGRLDFLCVIKGYKCLVDFKTNVKGEIYKESGLQLAFYGDTLKENNIIDVDRKIVVCCSSTGEITEKDTNDQIWEVENILEVWKWLKKKGGF